ncbi:hypothetical protein TEA_006508 [Camellia sinensis var. sinensis]|uniref:xyloglucan:xyloglucosyl transferase n=1 Tax=Camellia sinensis var. sinensis TaxID=542762 RepID=A0A4S4EJD9_CAMSN|nr:hypothetical protein TEA_006508 [Camellia sinensis var. sinensis]
MATSSSPLPFLLIMMSLLIISCWVLATSASNFYQDFDISWGDGRAKILNNGDLLTLSLDKPSGSGFQSKNEYLFGKIDVQLKLVPGNSAGTVTAYYLSSQGPTHDEIDFEFLGNLSGDPYILHTNVFGQGKGNREQQFYLWFDPTANFHTYSVLWNPKHIIFSVDGTPIREFKNLESIGVRYPKDQPMRIYSSLWNADDWATRGGLVKTDWTQAPFTASYRNFNANACIWSSGASSCSSSSNNSNAWLAEELDSTSQQKLKWVRNNYMIYNYCTDSKRFPQGLPPECSDNGEIKGFSRDCVRLLPSELWLVRNEIESWRDYPIAYLYRVLRIILCFVMAEDCDFLKWIIVNSPCYDVVIDVPMKDHISLSFMSLCWLMYATAMLFLKQQVLAASEGNKEEDDWLPPPPKVSADTLKLSEDSTIKELRVALAIIVTLGALATLGTLILVIGASGFDAAATAIETVAGFKRATAVGVGKGLPVASSLPLLLLPLFFAHFPWFCPIIWKLWLSILSLLFLPLFIVISAAFSRPAGRRLPSPVLPPLSPSDSLSLLLMLCEILETEFAVEILSEIAVELTRNFFEYYIVDFTVEILETDFAVEILSEISVELTRKFATIV